MTDCFGERPGITESCQDCQVLGSCVGQYNSKYFPHIMPSKMKQSYAREYKKEELIERFFSYTLTPKK
jgi:hypothetical protein